MSLQRRRRWGVCGQATTEAIEASFKIALRPPSTVPPLVCLDPRRLPTPALANARARALRGAPCPATAPSF